MRAEVSKRRRLRELAERRHGVVARCELLAAGLSSAAISRLIRNGELVPIYRGVYLVHGHRATWLSRVAAATVLASGHASHRAAASLWNLTDPTTLVEVTTSRRPREPGVKWHRGVLSADETTTVDGVPVTSVHRTLIDLGDVADRQLVEDALDRALDRHLTSPDWLQGQIERLGTKGRKGAGMLRSILTSGHERSSWLERRLARVLETAPLPPYFRELSVGNYFLDFAWPEVMLAVEVHGEKWHNRRTRWAKDLARHNELTALGWTLLHFTWDEIRNEPRAVVREIRETYERLALRLDVTAR